MHQRDNTVQGSETLFQDSLLDISKKAKELTKNINWIRTQKKTEYCNDLIKLKAHSSVDVRRKSIATLGEIGSKNIIEDLRQWQQEESDRESWIKLETTIDRLNRKINDKGDGDISIFTVSEALGMIKSLIGNKEYCIEGELSEVRPVRNFYFFALKDKIDIRLNCILVSYSIHSIGFALNEGLQVRVRGSFRLGKDSRIQFDVKKISLTGEGELLRNLTLLDQKLQLEGLYDPTRKRRLPQIPQKILLLTSPVSAAINDFCKVLDSRRKGVNIYFLPIKTQGVGAEYDLLQAIKQAHNVIKQYSIESVVITRGGGSKDDLSLFNSEAVVRAIHSIPAPTIVAIGHERDTTLSEKVADVRASTPSNSAELVSRTNEEIITESTYLFGSINHQFLIRKNEYLSVTRILYQKIIRSYSRLIQDAREVVIRSDRYMHNFINTIKIDTQNTYSKIFSGAFTMLMIYKERIPNTSLLHHRVKEWLLTQSNSSILTVASINTSIVHYLESKKTQLHSITQILTLLDPRNTLKKGYALIYQDNNLITRIKHRDKDKGLTITMFDGNITFFPEDKAKNKILYSQMITESDPLSHQTNDIIE